MNNAYLGYMLNSYVQHSEEKTNKIKSDVGMSHPSLHWPLYQLTLRALVEDRSRERIACRA